MALKRMCNLSRYKRRGQVSRAREHSVQSSECIEMGQVVKAFETLAREVEQGPGNLLCVGVWGWVHLSLRKSVK